MSFSLECALTLKIVKILKYCYPYISYIYKQPLKGAPWNICSLRHGKPDTLNITNDREIRTHYNDRED